MLLGQIVVAAVQTGLPASAVEMKRRIVEACRGRLEAFMILTKIRVVTVPLATDHSKKSRC